MDVVEFVERFMNVELYEWQKECLRRLDSLRSEGKIHVVCRKGHGYIYLDRMMQKELIPHGKTNDCK